MNSNASPIPIPPAIRLQLFCRTKLPLIAFVTSLALLMYLWSRRAPQVSAVAQVESSTVVVPAKNSGVLKRLENPLVEYSWVEQGQTLVAEMDVSQQEMQRHELLAERDRLLASLNAESERLRIEQTKLDQQYAQSVYDDQQQELAVSRSLDDAKRVVDDRERDLGDLKQQHRSLGLQISQMTSDRQVAQSELAIATDQAQRVAKQVRLRIAPAYQLAATQQEVQLKTKLRNDKEQLLRLLQKQNDDVEQEIDDAALRLAEAKNQYERKLTAAKIADRKSGLPAAFSEDPFHPARDQNAWTQDRDLSLVTTRKPPSLDTETVLEPLRKALVVQERKIQTLSKQIAENQVVAPVSGMVAAVHHPPGTWVPSGEPLVTIASEKSRWITAYVSAASSSSVQPNDSVVISRRLVGVQNSPRKAESRVIQCGVAFEMLPVHLRPDPTVVEYVLPVKIAIPPGFRLMPGEVLDVAFASTL